MAVIDQEVANPQTFFEKAQNSGQNKLIAALGQPAAADTGEIAHLIGNCQLCILAHPAVSDQVEQLDIQTLKIRGIFFNKTQCVA